MSKSELYSIQLERQALSGLLKFPEVLSEIDNFVKNETFYEADSVHSTIYSSIKILYEKNGFKPLNSVVLADYIKNLGLAAKGDINIFDYIENLFFSTITKEATLESFKQLLKYQIARELVITTKNKAKFVHDSIDQPIEDIIRGYDSIHSDKLNTLLQYNPGATDIFESLEKTIEHIGNNPPDESKFMYGPFPTINRIYGSLSRPGNLTICGSRSGVGKTSLSMFVNTFIAEKYNVPILHADAGEMSPLELQIRATCMFCQGRVPYWAIESGEWRNKPEWEQIVREVWPRVKKIKFYYENISGLKPIEIISLIRKFSINKVGRDNFFIISYDYLKSFDVQNYNTPDWLTLGLFTQQLKSLVEGELNATGWIGLQLNKLGITNNKKAAEIVDNEEAFSLSDKILQQSTHSLLVRNKVNEEIAEEGNRFGNLKAIFLKHRHLGKDFDDALRPVKIGKNKYQKNYVNLQGYSFHFEDRGDLNQMVREMNRKVDITINKPSDNNILD